MPAGLEKKSTSLFVVNDSPNNTSTQVQFPESNASGTANSTTMDSAEAPNSATTARWQRGVEREAFNYLGLISFMGAHHYLTNGRRISS